MVVAALGHNDIHFDFWFDLMLNLFFISTWIALGFQFISKWFLFDNAITFAFKFDFYSIFLSVVLFPLFCSHVPFHFQFWFIFIFYSILEKL